MIRRFLGVLNSTPHCNHRLSSLHTYNFIVPLMMRGATDYPEYGKISFILKNKLIVIFQGSPIARLWPIG